MKRLLLAGWLSVVCLANVWAQPEKSTAQRIVCTSGQAVAYPCQDVDLLAVVPPADLGNDPAIYFSAGVRVNDLWGWTDPETGREYAIVGLVDGTSFVDITDPVNPVVLGKLPSHSSASLWRDMKVYKNHAFIVNEHIEHGMQVFDLTQLRTVSNPPVTFEETAHYDQFGSAHNIAINEDTGFAYAVGARRSVVKEEDCVLGLHMINIQNPAKPRFAGCFLDLATGYSNRPGYVHDVQCVVYHGPDADYQGREICFSANETKINIVDVTDKANPQSISMADYPNPGYVHQGWLTEDHRYFLQDDELDEGNPGAPTTRTIVWDVEDLDDPILHIEHLGTTTSRDHNQYVVGNYAFQANYTSGLRILDLSNIDQHKLREVAFFDTHPSDDAVQFGGAWSVYPFFESGTVIVSDETGGLFVLEPTNLSKTTATEPEAVPAGFALSAAYPNPFNPMTQFTLTVEQPQPVTVRAYDIRGRVVAVLHDGPVQAGTHRLTFDASNLPSGTYLVRAEAQTARQTQTVTLAK